MGMPDPNVFGQRWLTAFSDHDLEAVLEPSPTTSCSPRPWPPGSCRTGAASSSVRPHCGRTGRPLARVPDLRFEIVGVYAGIDIVMINYRNQAGGMVSEVLTFADGLVVAGHGSYLMTGGRPGG